MAKAHNCTSILFVHESNKSQLIAASSKMKF